MNASPRRGWFAGSAAFVIGVPLGLGVLWALHDGPWQGSEWKRYVEHPVEMAEVLLFCCALTALAGKLLGGLRERWAFAYDLLPRWNGKAVPVTEAQTLRQHVAGQPRHVRSSWLGQRVAGVLDFVNSRGSVNELDDQLRTLSDNDALAQDGSYSLLRFITWAIPILGFLGTVVGITGAVANVTPETLEQSLSGVTSGLATAFDTTALALFLTMILMFFSFVSERFEHNVLQRVDAYVDAELAHRFERTGAECSPIVEALRHNSQNLLMTAEQLVERQAALWGRTIAAMEHRWNEAASRQFETIHSALTRALDETLTRYLQHLRQTEEKFLARSQTVMDGLTATAERFRLQTIALAQLQDNEAQLLRLHEALNENLAAVANTGAFEQAVQSLTAAIHLLTARVATTAPAARLTKPAA
ncbi:MAG: MotA/TolQ/ExbB proton channel family protein [Gemmataceae bacterium]|nr:MotA/TolQ/ExbB proton channel family protein [Gemmataceae bacterium]